MAAKYVKPRLEGQDKRQLLKWIGTRGRLQLIYSAERDGCDPSVFHNRCDNVGPTVAVAFNQAGYVFGGYTSKSWQSTGSWINDTKAFLFRLRDPKGNSPMMYNGNSPYIYPYSTYGPCFGYSGDPELTLFSGKYTKNGNVFTDCDLCINLKSNGFNNYGHSQAEFCGSDYNIYDFQVYQVQDVPGLDDDKPWRKAVDAWTDKIREGLKKEVSDHRPYEELSVPKVNILMMGPVGAGKSSFFNTINSVYRGYVTAQAVTGTATHSLTTQYRRYDLRMRSGGPGLYFRLCDTMGVEEEQGLDVTDIPYILDGNIPDRFQFNPLARITPATSGFIRQPSLADSIHVTAFVLKAGEPESTKVLEKLSAIRAQVNQRGIPLVVLLTHVDQLCLEVAQSPSTVFNSDAVLEAVEDTAVTLGVPKSHVLPVKNYESEAELDHQVDILALLALRQILRFADNFFDDQLDLFEESKSSNTIKSSSQIQSSSPSKELTKSSEKREDLYTPS